MQKTKILCLILAMVLASAGTAGIVMDLSGEAVVPPIPDNAANTVWERPEDGIFVDNDAIRNLFIAQGELQRKGGFVGTTRGTSVSAGITQDVYNNRVVIGNNVFKEMITVGIVKNAYQLYIYNDSYIHRKFNSIKDAENIEWADTAVRYDEEQFISLFGHRSNSLTGYILNEETVLSGELEKVEDGLYTYRYVLDINTAPARMLYEMRTNSNLNGFATFVKAEIIVTMDNDWQVKTLRTDCKYKVPMMGVGFDCVEDVTETFGELTSDELPEKDFFEPYLDAEITVPVDQQPDALSVLMDIFGPYIGGGKLNLSFDAAMDGQTLASGALSAKIDIENIANIEVAAKLGEDLFVEYGNEKLFVTYQDFKGSTTVQGIMDAIAALMPKDEFDLNGAINTDEILSNVTYNIVDNVCVVSLPLDLGENHVDVKIYADVVEDGYCFTNAEVQVGSFKLGLQPADEFTAPEHTEEYAEILGLLDLVQNGVICGNVNAFGLEADVMLSLDTMTLCATSGDIEIIYSDNNVYVTFGTVKVKLDIDDVEYVMALLKRAGVLKGDVKLEMPQMSVEQVLTLLADITATATEDGVRFDLGMGDITAALYLATADNGWNIEKVTVNYGENVITLTAQASFAEEIPDVNAEEYADVADLLDTFVPSLAMLTQANSYGAEFNAKLAVDGAEFDVDGMFRLDVNGNVNVVASASNGAFKVLNANVTVCGDVVYLDVNGIKAAVALNKDGSANKADFTGIIDQVKGVNDNVDGIIDAVFAVVEKAINLDVTKIDFATLIKEFGFENGVLNVVVNADILGLDDIALRITTNKEGDLVVGVNGLTLDCLQIYVSATVLTNVGKVQQPNADDYLINLQGSVSNIDFAVTVDVLNTDVYARVEVLGQTVLARYVDGRIYAKVDELAISATVDELAELVKRIMAELGMDATDVDMSKLANVDLSVKAILSSLKLDLTSASPIVSLDIGELANVSVQFDSDAMLTEIAVNAMGLEVSLYPASESVTKLDINEHYINIVEVANHIVDELSLMENGFGVDFVLALTLNNGKFDVSGTFRTDADGNVKVVANVTNGTANILTANVTVVDGVVYLDVNGIRTAFALNKDGSVNQVDLTSIIDQVKGVNGNVDGIIETVLSVMEKITSLDVEKMNFADLVKEFRFKNGELGIVIDADILGLNDIDVTLSLNKEGRIVASINGVSLANVTINVQATLLTGIEAVEQPNACDYLINLQGSVSNVDFTVTADLLNMDVYASVKVLGRTVLARYVDGLVYVKLDNVALCASADELPKLIERIMAQLNIESADVDMSKLADFDLSVKSILSSLNFDLASAAPAVSLDIGELASVFVKFDSEAKLTEIAVKAMNLEVSLYPTCNPATKLDTNETYYNLVDTVDGVVTEINSLINADGYKVSFDGTIAFGSNVYDVIADVNYNNGLYVDAKISYKTLSMLNVELWYVDNTVYAQVGNLKFAIKTNAKSTGEGFELASLKGYNDDLDGILSLVESIIDKVSRVELDFAELLGGIGYDGSVFDIVLDGTQLGLSNNINVGLQAGNGVRVSINGLAADSYAANFNATVAASDCAVTAPKGDFTTNIAVKLDEVNTAYANIDLINGVYNVKLDDLYLQYANKTIKINKGNMFVSGNIDKITEIVKKIDDLVNEFSGATESTAKIDFTMFDNVDVRAIVKSLAISALGDGVHLTGSALGFNFDATFVGGELLRATVPVSIINKTLEITPANKQQYVEFTDEQSYISIDRVLEDYFPVFEKLVNTNSWRFSFDGDSLVTLNNQQYMLAKGSYLEFYFKNTEGLSTFKLRAKLDIRKLKADNTWQEFMLLDIVYKDGNIYVSDTGRNVGGKRNTIRLTVSVDTIKQCLALYGDLVGVVPQIGQLVQDMKDAMAEAENNAEISNVSNILKDVSYNNNVFGMVLDGKVLLSKLGEVALSAQTYGDGLSLDCMTLSYDGISVQLNNMRVEASALTEDGQYAAVQDILAYDYDSYHVDFNSLYELLSAFVITATPTSDDGTRSFYIDGTALVNLMNIVEVKMGLSVKVDITEKNDVYISAKVYRSYPSGIAALAYNDKGGNSYLNYDSTGNDGLGSFAVIRDSMKKGSGTHKEDVEEMYYYCDACNKDASRKSVMGLEYECPTKTGGFLGIGGKPLHDSSHIKKAWRTLENQDVPNTVIDNNQSIAEYGIDTETFTGDIINYILKLFNFSSIIESPIKDAINKENTNDFGIEDLFKDYSYSNTEYKYSVNLDLSPIDSNLGAVALDITHAGANDFHLTKLDADMQLLSNKCSVDLSMTLKESVYGQTTAIVKENTHW